MEEKRNNATEKVDDITKTLTEEQKRFLKEEQARETAAYDKMESKERFAREKHRFADEKHGYREYDLGGNGGNGGNGGKKNKSSGTGWIIAVVALGTFALIMTTLFVISITSGMGGNKQLNGTVEEAYYDFVNYVDSMDVDMSKLIVSNDVKQQQRILSELSAKARLAANDISRLPLKDESKFYTTKFVNQVGDYSKYLNNKLIDGLSVTDDDKNNLKNLYEINGELKRELTALTADMGANYDFKTLLDDNAGGMVTGKFDELESNAVDYPKLIYDGPFSDALDEKTPKGLDGEELSLAAATEITKKVFSSYGLTDVEADGTGDGVIKTYNFDCKTEDNGKMYVETSVVGGRPVIFECYRDCTEERISLEQAEDIADKFLERLASETFKRII